jgi:hypothetical protein
MASTNYLEKHSFPSSPKYGQVLLNSIINIEKNLRLNIKMTVRMNYNYLDSKQNAGF